MLQLNDVELYYDHVYALKGVSVELNEGETIALIGANGAGKSSILRAITGLNRIHAGAIQFLGERIDGLAPDDIVRRGIAMVPEGRRVFPYMSVKDNLLMGAFSRSDAAGIRHSLDSVLVRFPRLKERYTQAAGTMSGGEQQMLAVGRALIRRPKLLMLDEPSLGLAPRMVDEVLAIAVRARDQGMTVLLVEQNVAKALSIADHAYVLERGRVSMHGPAAELARSDRIRAAYLGVG
jgi:branched-chain amino acid transport system ATP-binding protein